MTYTRIDLDPIRDNDLGTQLLARIGVDPVRARRVVITIDDEGEATLGGNRRTITADVELRLKAEDLSAEDLAALLERIMP